MMLALVLALAVLPRVLPVLDETVTVPAADWKAFPIPVPLRPARIDCGFEVEGGGSGVRLLLIERADFERMSAGQGYHALAATAYQRSGGFAYRAPPGDYVIVADNRMEGRGPVEVRLQVELVFEAGGALPRTLSPERRAVVVGLSVLFFGAVALFAGGRLWRAFR
jgi:hypothetical protein